MLPETYINQLPDEDCQKPIAADVAWLRMVYRHLKQGVVDATNGDITLLPLHNAVTYVEEMIYKSVEG